MKVLLRIIIGLVFLSGFGSFHAAQATHLMGGDLIYDHLYDSTYEVKFYVYRDCSEQDNAPIDPQISYHVYNASDSSYEESHNVPVDSITDITNDIPGCGTGTCIEVGTYTHQIQLGHDPEGHYITWARNERNHAVIDNLNCNSNCPGWVSSECSNPYGNIWQAFIPPHKYKNSSPRFETEPVPHLCVNRQNIFNHNASDPDGDSLGFRLITPKSPPGQCGGTPAPTVSPGDIETVGYNSGYSASNPFGPNSTVAIDSNTGQVTVNPNQQGHYVMAIEVREYRIDPLTGEATFMGSVIRDLQFMVGSCPGYTEPFFTDTTNTDHSVDPFDTLSFEVTGKDTASGATDSVFVSATGDIFGDGQHHAKFPQNGGLDSASSTFQWVPDCGDVTTAGSHIITFNLQSETCGVDQQTHTIDVDPQPIQPPPEFQCLSIKADDHIELSWQDTQAYDDFNYYSIYRRGPNEPDFQQIATLENSSKSSYTDSSIQNPAEQHSYYLRVANSCEQEGFTSDTLHTLSLNVNKTGPTELTINWNNFKNSDSNQYYHVEARDQGASTFSLIDSVNDEQFQYASCQWEGDLRISLDNEDCNTSSLPNGPHHIEDSIAPEQQNLFKTTFTHEDTFRADIEIKDTANIEELFIQKGDPGNLSTFDTLKGPYPDTLNYSFYYPDDKQQCFSITAIDSCGNLSDTSDTHCPIYTEGEAGNLSATLNWDLYSGSTMDRYRLQERDGQNWSSIDTFDASRDQYLHDSLPCNITQDYRITGDFENKALITYSNPVSVTPFDTIAPEPPNFQKVTTQDSNEIKLEWEASPSERLSHYEVHRKKKGGTFTLIDSAEGETYTDNVSFADETWCYALKAVDSCGPNVGPITETHCGISLSLHTENCNQEIKLDWTGYEGWQGPPDQYSVYRYEDGQWQHFTDLNDTSLTDSSAHFPDGYCYRVEGEKDGLNSVSNTVCDTTFEPLAPEIRSVSKTASGENNGVVEITWDSNAQDHIDFYRLFHSSGNGFSVLDDTISTGDTSFTHQNINTASNDHHYYLTAVDTCGNEGLDGINHKTMDLTLSVGQLIHEIDWTPYEGFNPQHYLVQQKTGNQFTTTDTVPSDTTYLEKYPAPCNEAFFYRIKAVGPEGHTSLSDTSAETAIDTIPPDGVSWQNITVNNDNNPELNFEGADSMDVFGYDFQRKDAANYFRAGFKHFDGPSANHSFEDTLALNSFPSCYSIVTQDSCLNETPSKDFCPINLQGEEQNLQNGLHWDHFKGYPIEKYILKTKSNGNWVGLDTLQEEEESYLHENLPCDVTRHYRLKGYEENGTRTTYSNIIELTPFDTLPPEPPEITTASINEQDETEISWQTPPASDAKFFEIRRATETTNFTIIDTVIREHSYTDQGVDLSNGPHQYEIVGIDSCANHNRSEASDPHHPIHLERLESWECKPEVSMEWTEYHGFKNDIAHYEVLRKEPDEQDWQIKDSLNSLNYVDDNVDEGKSYCYRIRGRKENTDQIVHSRSLCREVEVLPDPVLQEISHATVESSQGNDSILVTWPKYAGADSLFQDYQLYHTTGSPDNFNKIASDFNQNDTSFYHQAESSKENFYQITALNTCNTAAQPSENHKPIVLEAENNNLEVALNWSAYEGSAIEEYRLIRRHEDEGEKELYTTSNEHNFIDSTVRCQHEYTYYVEGVLEEEDKVTHSNKQTLTAFDEEPPETPQILSASVEATGSSNGQINLQFNGASDDNRKSYEIYRSIDGDDYQLIHEMETNKIEAISYRDEELNTANEAHSYEIISADSCNNFSSASPHHTSMVLNAEAENGENVLNWTHYESFDDYHYQVQRKTESTRWLTLDTVSSDENQYRDEQTSCDTLYQYQVVAHHEEDTVTAYSNTDEARAFLDREVEKPDITRATVENTSTGEGVIDLEWTHEPVRDNINLFNIYRTRDRSEDHRLVAQRLEPSFTDSSLNTRDNAYSYEIEAVDSCDNVSPASNHHRTIYLQVEEEEKANRLVWEAYEGWTPQNYRIERNGEIIAEISGSQTNYRDEEVYCVNEYEYRIIAENDEGVQSASNRDEGSPLGNEPPKPAEIYTASVEEEGTIHLNWHPSPDFDVEEYIIRRNRQNQGGGFREIKTLPATDTAFIDDLGHIEGPVCYEVLPVNRCNTVGEAANSGCIIYPEGRAESLENHLEWTPYRNWKEGVGEYRILKTEDNAPETEIGTVQGDSTSFTDSNLTDHIEDYCYRIESVHPENPARTSLSPEICLQQEAIIHMPNSFSPGVSIGVNDIFEPGGMYIDHYDMEIYNRWGQLIYETQDSKGWDGTVEDGEYAEAGTYFYTIRIVGEDGHVTWKEGTVNVVR